MRTCSIEGCERPHSGRGWCRTHYLRWYNHGDPLAAVEERGLDPLRRMLRRVVTAPSGCWIWTGERSIGGYGRSTVNGRHVTTHKWLYEQIIGAVPDGMQLDHYKCDNGAGGCVNPFHCRPASAWENSLRSDCVSSLSLAKTECVNGHPFDEENTRYAQGRRWCRACDRARNPSRRRAA